MFEQPDNLQHKVSHGNCQGGSNMGTGRAVHWCYRQKSPQDRSSHQDTEEDFLCGADSMILLCIDFHSLIQVDTHSQVCKGFHGCWLPLSQLDQGSDILPSNLGILQ